MDARVDIREGERGGRLWPLFFRDDVHPSLRVSYLVFALFCEKCSELLWSHINVICFSSNTKIMFKCAKGAPQPL